MNKYRRIQQELPAGEPPKEAMQIGLDGGFRGDVTPRLIPLNSSPELDEVRFERKAIRKDFGHSSIGSAADSVILAVGEHKFISEGESFHRLFRLTRSNLQCKIEVWDGTNWVDTATSEETILNQYLDFASSQGCLYVADGSVLLEWCETAVTTSEGDDFPSANSMTAVGDEEEATISPGSEEEIEYTINYDVEITSNPGSTDYTITLEFYHGAVLLGSKEYVGATDDVFPLNFDNEAFVFNRQISDTELVKIKVASEDGGDVVEEDGPMGFVGGSAPEFEIDKTPAEEDVIGSLLFKYEVTWISGTITVGFYTFDGTSWTKEDETTHGSGGSKQFPITPSVDLNDPGAKFGFHVESKTDADNDAGQANVEWTYEGGTFDVHGHNLLADGDATAGVTYELVGDPSTVFQEVSPDAPGARFILPFGDRLLAFRDEGDTQKLSWSADGDLDEWAGGDSGATILVDTRSDGIDDLMGGAVLGPNFVAVFRKRSIMRAFETGNQALAVGVTHWIENLGTDSPFSLQSVRSGVLFLGHDFMVYLLTEQGPVPVGEPIHQELIEVLTDNQELVDSAYDSVFGEYYLGIPQDGAGQINRLWIFDYNSFLERQEIIWRSRSISVERLGTTSVVL